MPNNFTTIARLRSIGWFIVFGGLIIATRLFYIQIIRHEHYKAQADEAHLAKFEIPASRGEIYLLDGKQPVPLVMNQTRYRLYADPRYIKDRENTAQKIAGVTGGDAAYYTGQLGKKSAYAVLEKYLDQAKAEQIKSLQLTGIGLTKVAMREYPEGALGSQIVGFVNDEGKGQYGIEQALDDNLKGRPGLLSGAVDVRGVPIATADSIQIPAEKGQSMILTIDRNIQAAAEKFLGEEVQKSKARLGSILVMDPRTGDIKAMANSPTFHPGDYRSAKDISVFSNAVVDDAYEPGSVAKVFTMSAGLKNHVVTPDTKYYDTGAREIDGYTIHNATTRPPGERTMTDVIHLSLNTGSIFVLESLGAGDINEEAKSKLYSFFNDDLELATAPKLPQTGVVAGSIRAPQGSSDVDYANMTFGQGLSLSMLKMGTAYSAIVNGGTLFEPRLVSDFIKPDGTAEPQARQTLKTGIVDAQVSQQIRTMMQTVVEDGLGRPAKRAGYIIGGKTGTAQKFNRETGHYGGAGVTSSFFGFGASNEADYVIIVRIDEPSNFAPLAPPAAAVFGKMSQWLIDYLAIPPVR